MYHVYIYHIYICINNIINIHNNIYIQYNIIIIYIYIVIHHIICFLSVLISSSAPALGAAEVTNEFSIRPYLVEQETIRGIKFTFRPAKSLGCRK